MVEDISDLRSASDPRDIGDPFTRHYAVALRLAEMANNPTAVEAITYDWSTYARACGGPDGPDYVLSVLLSEEIPLCQEFVDTVEQLRDLEEDMESYGWMLEFLETHPLVELE